jgi:hypothetical protein
MVDPHEKFRVTGEELNSDASEVGHDNRIYWHLLDQLTFKAHIDIT